MKPTMTEDGWIILADENVASSLQGPEYYLRIGSEVVRYRNRVVFRLEEDNGDVLYAKWLYPQKEGIVKKAENCIKRFFRGPRVRRIFTIHKELLASGFNCPEPVFAAWRKDDLTELFVCKEINVPPAHKILRDNKVAHIWQVLKLIAKDLRRLHDAGFVHGDAIPGNICVDEDAGKVFYLDNDRTRHSTSKRQALRNVVQFCAHLPFYCALPDAAGFFIDNYGIPKDEKATLLSVVKRRVDEITAERNKRHRQ